ncbi:MAG: hypothetical protein HY699_16630 [Deltaproteobacteria bacterium]|nr:hypothetical protein [Deltaproteobacteria bacterium]
MGVLILGAGASKAAGYPLASELMPAIDVEMSGSHVMDKKQWSDWVEYRESASGHLRLVLACPNPEVTLSLLDLYEHTLAAHDDAEMSRRLAAWRAAPELPVDDSYYQLPERDELHRGVVAWARLLACLYSYFGFRHYDDSTHRPHRDYLRGLLVSLQPGDVVITFNWDTTVERTLAEQEMWSPFNGYGFEKVLLMRSPIDEPSELPSGLPMASPITVLKLHGSFGWQCASDGNIIFDHRYYLNHFDFWWNGNRLPLIDPLAPRVGPPRDYALEHPTFLKRIRGSAMQEVWHRATTALSNASMVEVWGYSLPASDIGPRVLLNGLRFRLERGDVDVHVHLGPDGESQRRWREFLGERATVDDRKLE